MPFVPHPPQKFVLNSFLLVIPKHVSLHLAVVFDYMSSINHNKDCSEQIFVVGGVRKALHSCTLYIVY